MRRITFGAVAGSVVIVLFAGSVPSARAITGIVNPSFEDASSFNGWDRTSGTSPANALFYAPPTDGIVQADLIKNTGVATKTDLATFLGVTADDIAAAAGVDLDDLEYSTGSAIKQHFTAGAPGRLTFDYNLFTPIPGINHPAEYPDSILTVLDGAVYLVSNTDLSTFPPGNTNFGVQWAGYFTFDSFPQLAAGEHDIAVAVIGSVATAGASVDNFRLSREPGTPVPEPLTATTGVLAIAALAAAAHRRRARG